MFIIEQFTQIINQLQNTKGFSYFETLGLILKLMGLCAGLILVFVFVAAMIYFIPLFLAKIIKPTPNGMKLYYVCFGDESNKDMLKLRLHHVGYSNSYEEFLIERGITRYKITWIITVIAMLLLSPFMFINALITMLLIVSETIYILILSFIGSHYQDNDWICYGAGRESCSDKIKKDIDTKVKAEVNSLNTVKKHMTIKKLSQHLNTVLEAEPYIIMIYGDGIRKWKEEV